MNHLHQLALDAQIAVHVMSNQDASEIEMLPLKPHLASDSEIQSLRDRWPNRCLRSAGVIGLVDGHVQMALQVPFGPGELAALLKAFTAYCACDAMEPEYDWSTQHYRLVPRTEMN